MLVQQRHVLFGSPIMKREDDLSIHIFGKISVDMARQRISWIRATNNNIVNIRVFQLCLQAYIHDITIPLFSKKLKLFFLEQFQFFHLLIKRRFLQYDFPLDVLIK